MSQHSTRVVTILAAAARGTDSTSSSADVSDLLEARMEIGVTAVSGSDTPTLNVYLEHQPDGFDEWFAIGNYTGITATGSYATAVTNFGKTVRARFTFSGTTPSFTFYVALTGKN